jgi:hypothetical protein
MALNFGNYAEYARGFYFRLRDSINMNHIVPAVDKSSIIKDGNWHMLTMTIDKAANPMGRCYLDGVEVGTTAVINAVVVPATNFILGQGMIGFLDQTAFWQKCLTPTEIGLLHNAGSGLAFSNW